MATIKVAVYPAEQSNPSGAEVLAETVPNALYFTDASAPTTDTDDHVVAASGLSEGVLYRAAVVWDDGSVQSPVAISSPWRTTGTYVIDPIVVSDKFQIAVSPTYTVQRLGVTTPQLASDRDTGQLHGSLDGVTVFVWDGPTPLGDPVYASVNKSLGPDGRMTIDLSGWTALPAGATVSYLLFKANEVDPRNSLYFGSQGTLVVLP